MKTALLICIALLLPCFFIGQASSPTSNPVVANGLGQPIPGANVAICASQPTGAGVCTGSSLVQTYRDATMNIGCTLNNSLTPPSPLIGAGCTNPGTTDGFGNALAYAAAGPYWCQYYGSSITGTIISPCPFPPSAAFSCSGPACVVPQYERCALGVNWTNGSQCAAPFAAFEISHAGATLPGGTPSKITAALGPATIIGAMQVVGSDATSTNAVGLSTSEPPHNNLVIQGINGSNDTVNYITIGAIAPSSAPALAYYCGSYPTNTSCLRQVSGAVVWFGTAVLNGASPGVANITITGVFNGGSDLATTCIGGDASSATSLGTTTNSGTNFVITGPNGSTDTAWFVCVANSLVPWTQLWNCNNVSSNGLCQPVYGAIIMQGGITLPGGTGPTGTVTGITAGPTNTLFAFGSDTTSTTALQTTVLSGTSFKVVGPNGSTDTWNGIAIAF